MSDKKKENIIEVKDFYGDNCLNDTLHGAPSNRKPEGRVHIYEIDDDGNKKLVEKSNLVVYAGREMLAQRLVNLNNSNVTSSKDEFVSWFGLGEGGVRPADPLNPVPPVSDDEYLNSPVPVSDTTATVYADFHAGGSTAPSGSSYPANGSYKKRFDVAGAGAGIEFDQDILNDSKYLVLKITTTIGVNDANGYQLSEAGLFSAESSNGGYNGNFTLFARVTFPSLIKSSDRRLIFVWYLYV